MITAEGQWKKKGHEKVYSGQVLYLQCRPFKSWLLKGLNQPIPIWYRGLIHSYLRSLVSSLQDLGRQGLWLHSPSLVFFPIFKAALIHNSRHASCFNLWKISWNLIIAFHQFFGVEMCIYEYLKRIYEKIYEMVFWVLN